MAKRQTSKMFPLRTVLVIMKAHQLGCRGVERTGVTEAHGKELLEHMYPGITVPSPRNIGHYLRYQFASLLGKIFPHLANVSVAKVTQSNFEEWMGVQESEFGIEVEVPVIGKAR